MFNHRIYKISKRSPKKLSSRVDITRFLTSDISIIQNLTTEGSSASFEYSITQDDLDEVNDNLIVDTNYYLPSFLENDDVIHVVLVDDETGYELSFGFFLVNIIQTNDINNGNQVISDKVYSGQIGCSSLEIFLSGIRVPNKTFTNPGFLLDPATQATVPRSVVEAEFNLEFILTVLLDIADKNSALKPGSISLDTIDFTPLEKGLGNQSLNTIVPNKSFTLEGLTLFQAIEEILRELKVVPGVRYEIDGVEEGKSFDPTIDRDLKLQVYDKQENFKDISRPFIDEMNIQGDLTRSETIDSSSFATQLNVNISSSITGSSTEFVKGYDSDTFADFYNYPAPGAWTALTALDKKVFFTAADRDSAFLSLPYPINRLDSNKILGHTITLTPRVFDNFSRDWIKNVDLVNVENFKFKYDIGTDAISGFFDSSTGGTAGLPRSIAKELLASNTGLDSNTGAAWEDGETPVSALKFNVQYEPVVDNFTAIHQVNTESLSSIPSTSNQTKSSINYAKTDKLLDLKDKNTGQAFNSISQVLYYDEFTLDDYKDISLNIGDRTNENRVVVSQTTVLSNGDTQTGGFVNIKADLVKNYVQANIDTPALSNFDPFGSSTSSIQRNDVIQDFLVLYDDLDLAEFEINTGDTGWLNSTGRDVFLKHLTAANNSASKPTSTTTSKDEVRKQNARDKIQAGFMKYTSGTSSFQQGGSTGETVYLAPKTYNGVSANGLIINGFDNVNFAPPGINAYPEDTATGGIDGEEGDRAVLHMRSIRYGNKFQQVKNVDIRIADVVRKNYVTSDRYSFNDSLPSSGINTDEEGTCFFSKYPLLETEGVQNGPTASLNNPNVIANDWGTFSESRIVNTTTYYSAGNAPTIYSSFSYNPYKDTQENLQIQMQVTNTASPSRYIYGPGLTAGNRLFSCVRGYSESDYTIVRFNDNLPLEIQNIRDLFEDYSYSYSNSYFRKTVTGDMNVYDMVGKTSGTYTASPTKASRYGDIDIETFTSQSMFTGANNKITFQGLNDDSKGYSYYMVFDGRGSLVYRSLKKDNFKNVSLSVLDHDPFLVKL